MQFVTGEDPYQTPISHYIFIQLRLVLGSDTFGSDNWKRVLSLLSLLTLDPRLNQQLYTLNHVTLLQGCILMVIEACWLVTYISTKNLCIIYLRITYLSTIELFHHAVSQSSQQLSCRLSKLGGNFILRAKTWFPDPDHSNVTSLFLCRHRNTACVRILFWVAVPQITMSRWSAAPTSTA